MSTQPCIPCTESGLGERLERHVKRLGLRVQSPAFTRTGMYAPQWRCAGSLYYYQLPRNGAVLALLDREHSYCSYWPNGVPMAELDRAQRQGLGARP